MKVLVTGVRGQLGYDVMKVLIDRNIECCGADIDEFDITSYEETSSFIKKYNPDAVIHCSAYTAVDKAEDNMELCSSVNVNGTINIAKVCKEIDAKMIYISTDYVFPGSGDKEYEINDPTGPLSVYGQTKLDGELAVKEILSKYFIVRISWAFGRNGNNFVKTMLKLGKERSELNVVSDQIGSPTYTEDLAPLLCDMIVTNKYGIYHATNEGLCSWAEFAEEIFKQSGYTTKVNKILTSDYPTKAKRPLNSRMSKKSLDEAEFSRLPTWQDALKRYLMELKKKETMNKVNISLVQCCAFIIVVFMVFSIGLYIIAGDQFKYKDSEKNIIRVEANSPVGVLQKGFLVEQTFLAETDTIENISLNFATYMRQNTGTVRIQLLDNSTKSVLMDKLLDISGFQDNNFVTIIPERRIEGIKGKILRISIQSDTGTPDNAVTLWYNNLAANQNEQLYFNNNLVNGVLSFKVNGKDTLLFGQYYFVIMGIIGIMLIVYSINLIYCHRKGKKSYGLIIFDAFTRYRFLLNQLISRDFKTKYKRSVLGMLWSFLNPLLSMLVQYMVFSTLFKSNIPNFAVYLLIGIVFFNFFSEATNMGIVSIVGNASLITKVYIPKYIFPISRTLSSTINLLISMLPLVMVALLTRTPITPALLLLPFSILCVITFCIGMTLILSSAMVYFRDTQFLWGVISMLWMYATPIFYPESILPQNLIFFFKLNPLYHFIRFSRIIILDGITPEPLAFLYSLIAAFVPLIIGVVVFKKTQDKFVLNI